MLTKQDLILILFNLLYILIFSIYYLSIKNFEFLWYIIITLLIFASIAYYQKKIQFSYKMLWLISSWGLLHMLGGGLIINGSVLYAFQIIPLIETSNFFILKYDQLVHFYLYFVMIFLIAHILKSKIPRPWTTSIYVFIALASIGIGALNEVIEFAAVLAFPQTGVGGYYNTALDIVFNTLGALLGTLLLKKRNTTQK